MVCVIECTERRVTLRLVYTLTPCSTVLFAYYHFVKKAKVNTRKTSLGPTFVWEIIIVVHL